MFLNRIFLLILLTGCSVGAQSAIRLGSDNIPYKTYSSANTDSLDVSAKVEIFDPPITITAKDVENQNFSKSLDRPDAVLTKYLQTLSDGSGVESASVNQSHSPW